MDERLMALADLVPVCAVAADVGADHGKLGVHLLRSGKCGHVYLTDISASSLEKARRLVEKEGLADQCQILVGDGLAPLPEFDAAVIAGMGAPVMIGILQAGIHKIGKGKLILEPNVGAERLRYYLAEAGFRIEDERVVRCAGRWYACMRAGRGEMRLTCKEALAGPALLARRDPNLAGYGQFRLRVAEKALRGAEKSDPAGAEGLRREMETWKEILNDLSEH